MTVRLTSRQLERITGKGKPPPREKPPDSHDPTGTCAHCGKHIAKSHGSMSFNFPDFVIYHSEPGRECWADASQDRRTA